MGAPVRADVAAGDAHGRGAPDGRRPRPLARLLRDADRSARARADGGRAALGTGGEDLLVLTEEPGAQPADGYSGLFHFALLVPERIDLARWLAHAARDRVALTGLSDHFVSEAIYLRDPDHHGIEIYADRPRELWEGQVGAAADDAAARHDDLLGDARRPGTEPFDGLAGGTVMGHVHLCVADVGQTVELLPRRSRFRADGAARRPGRVPQRRRLPPSPRRQHVAERRAPPMHRRATRG